MKKKLEYTLQRLNFLNRFHIHNRYLGWVFSYMLQVSCHYDTMNTEVLRILKEIQHLLRGILALLPLIFYIYFTLLYIAVQTFINPLWHVLCTCMFVPSKIDLLIMSHGTYDLTLFWEDIFNLWIHRYSIFSQ